MQRFSPDTRDDERAGHDAFAVRSNASGIRFGNSRMCAIGAGIDKPAAVTWAAMAAARKADHPHSRALRRLHAGDAILDDDASETLRRIQPAA